MNCAIVLCGGFSRRLGRDKCQIRLGDQTLIGHVLHAVYETVDTVVAVGRVAQKIGDVIPEEFRDKVNFICDSSPDCGPLEGLRAGLAAIQDSHRAAFVCGCDCPLITPAFIEFLFHEAEGFQAAVPWIDGKLLPIPAVYHADALPKIESALEAGERSLWRMVVRLQAHRLTRFDIETIDPSLKSLVNINDEPTLETVTAIWAQRTAQPNES